MSKSSNRKYEYKGNIYALVDVAEMKNPQTREWQICYIYLSKDGRMFVREKEEFLRLFKEV